MDAARRDLNREFRYLAWGLIGLLIVTTVLLVIAYDTTSDADAAAKDKADTFLVALEEAGLQQPDRDTIARVYGTDGGRACTMSEGDIQQALAAFNAQRTGEINGRPGQIDPRAREYERTMISTYCPDRLEAFDDYVDGLRFRRTRPEL